jgi:hypothetical protein
MTKSLALVFLLACGPSITETRMMSAPPREAGCALELVHADITQVSFNQTWDVLGYVSLVDRGGQDPAAEANRALVRPRACAMGGTSIAVALASTSMTAMGSGSGLVYMVLRPKAPPAAATTF